MVAGGIGQTPFLALAARISACARYGDPPRERAAGARRSRSATAPATADYLAGVDDFRRAGRRGPHRAPTTARPAITGW